MGRSLKPVARRLRRDSTEAEKKLWSVLRNRQIEGMKFRRQVPCCGYVVDFICREEKLIIEVDGGQHSEDLDALRTRRLEQAGYRVIRFWNNEVLQNIEGVITGIASAVNAVPHPDPLPKGEGDERC
ncbi:MAG: endonuclease domain-containing protein [Alphaproteobacteria bacterium]